MKSTLKESTTSPVIRLFLLAALSLSLSLTGCATKAMLQECNPFPKGASRIVLVRESSINGAGGRLKIFDPGKVYDGENVCSNQELYYEKTGWLVGKLSSGGSLAWYRVPGRMWLTVEVFGIREQNMIEEVVTEPNKEYTINIGTIRNVIGTPSERKRPKITVRDIPSNVSGRP